MWPHPWKLHFLSQPTTNLWGNLLFLPSKYIQNSNTSHHLHCYCSWTGLWRASGHWSLSVSPISYRQDSSLHDLPLAPKGTSEQLIMEGTAKKPHEARLKGPEKFINIRRPTTWDAAHILTLATTPLLSCCYKSAYQILPGWDTVFRGRSLLCLPLPGKAIKLFFSTSKFCLWDLIRHWCTEAELLASLPHIFFPGLQ